VPGFWNERLGWLLLLVGLTTAVVLDPWSLSERDPAALLGSTRMAARHAQAVVLAMGFLQIAVALVLREPGRSGGPANLARWVLGAGTLVYVAGYAGLAAGLDHGWLVLSGATLNLFGFALLAWAVWRTPAPAAVRAVLATFLLGMALDVLLGMALDVAGGLSAVNSGSWLPVDLGPEDGVRQRMVRLARVAATALSLLTLLDRGQPSAGAARPWDRWGRLGLIIGTVGMPTVLTAASFIALGLKYLLPIPALAMTGGVTVALVRAARTASRLEQYGWLLIVLSMGVGLVIGMYAFDGPLPTPAFVGAYNEFARRLIRLGHAYTIVFGLLAVLLARQGAGPLAVRLFVAGNCVALVSIVLMAFVPLPTAVLAAGPALIVPAVLLGVRWGDAPGKKARDIFPEREPEGERGRTAQREPNP
jgi:hypothetical protein